MKKEITITSEENSQIENLFLTYQAYMSMLTYLAEQGIENTTVYDKKWAEATDIWIKLDAAKRAVEVKYKPAGNWDRYEFDFEHSQVVFVKE